MNTKISMHSPIYPCIRIFILFCLGSDILETNNSLYQIQKSKQNILVIYFTKGLNCYEAVKISAFLYIHTTT